MSGPYDRPRVYVNWQRMKPAGWRAWAAAIGFVAVAFAVLALVAVIASTLFVVAIVIALVAAVAFFVGNLFKPRQRGVEPYRGGETGPYRGNDA